MPTGNITWSNMTPEEEARYKKSKARSDALSNPQENKGITSAGNVPKKVNMGGGAPAVMNFKAVKAYNTRAKRTG